MEHGTKDKDFVRKMVEDKNDATTAKTLVDLFGCSIWLLFSSLL
jgi:hypothetical protein